MSAAVTWTSGSGGDELHSDAGEVTGTVTGQHRRSRAQQREQSVSAEQGFKFVKRSRGGRRLARG